MQRSVVIPKLRQALSILKHSELSHVDHAGFKAIHAYDSARGAHGDASQNAKSSIGHDLSSVPSLIKVLGFGGALPFFICSPMVADVLGLEALLGVSASQAGMLQVGYGATIISFLGGVHWGLAMTNLTPMKLTGQRYLWSVMPCLMAWPTLGGMTVPHAAGTQAALLALVYLVDRGWYRRGGLPPWYMALRLPLTGLAIGGLALTATTS